MDDLYVMYHPLECVRVTTHWTQPAKCWPWDIHCGTS